MVNVWNTFCTHMYTYSVHTHTHRTHAQEHITLMFLHSHSHSGTYTHNVCISFATKSLMRYTMQYVPTGGSTHVCKCTLPSSSLLPPLPSCILYILVHIIRFSCVFMFGSQHSTFWFSTSSYKTLYLHHSCTHSQFTYTYSQVLCK